MEKKAKELLKKFFSGAFGTFLLLCVRGIPPLPGIASHVSYVWLGAGFVVSGGIATLTWQVGDDQPIRSFIFGMTWPALVALTR
jgi:phosphotransferase system  glucose/maltose/N-acetylglucosamine-specific IIC component